MPVRGYLLVFLFGFSTTIYADYLDRTPAINSPGLLNLDYEGVLDKVSIKAIDIPDVFQGDGFELTAQVGDKAISYKFSAAYGEFTLYISPLKQWNKPQLVLIRGQGHGTAATMHYLDILDIADGQISKQYEKLIASPFGGAMWWYGIKFSHSDSSLNVYDIELKLDHDPIEEHTVQNPKLIPKDKMLTIYWDQYKHQFMERSVPGDGSK